MRKARKTYNVCLRGIKREFGLSHAQARVAWRGLRDRLERSPSAVDLKRHPRIASQEAKRAPFKERAIRGAKTRAAKRAALEAVLVKRVPPEFVEVEAFFGGEDFSEEQEY